MNKLLAIIGLILLLSCNNNKNPRIQISTNFGNIEAELYPGKAPATVAAFLSYIDSGFYKNSSFYRVVYEESMGTTDNSGLIQGGIWQSNTKKAAALKGIVHESPKQTGLSHSSGTLSLARTTPGTANSEFFICIGDQSGYDSANDGLGFAAFGKVISGMEIVRKIHSQPFTGQSFDKPIIITNIERL
jgi:peptidyl-prolyl cis-trans isomerase A (cyclophilin A)